MVKQKVTRGPPRAKGSRIKLTCAYAKCKRKTDVKNVSVKLQLSCKEVLKDQCRKLSAKCKVVRFCCAAHMQRCHLKHVASNPRGGRQPFTTDQIITVYEGLLNLGCAWAAVLALLQLFTGDRADAARQCTWAWFSGLDPTQPESPSISIPKVNGKTVPRTIPLYTPFRDLLWQWAFGGKPLTASDGATWPHPDQPKGSDDVLFPGFDANGQKRKWNKSVSERAYLRRLTQVADVLCKARAAANSKKLPHPFNGYDLTKLGTHSFKKTAVTLMSQHGVPWSVISAITGTSAKMLQTTYDIPTEARQQHALQTTWGDMLPPHGERQDNAKGKTPGKTRFSGCCGAPVHENHKFCTECGQRL